MLAIALVSQGRLPCQLVKRIVLVHVDKVRANNTSPGLQVDVDVHLPLSVENPLDLYYS